MRHRLSQLMDVARDNDRLFDKTRRLVLDLLDAGSLGRAVDGEASGGLLAGCKTICGVRRPDGLAFLCGEDASKEIGSGAVVALDHQQGLLAIGSRDPQHYRSSLGTLFLGYIAEVL